MTAFSIWLLLGGFIGLLWFARLIAVEFALRSRCILRESSYSSSPRILPRLSMVLAGKDEESNIEACVRSLLDQDYPDFELIVIDDRSTDRTPQILQKLSSEFPERLKVIRVSSLPAGWFGKHNAVRVGMQHATGDWLFFSDADCRQTSKRSLSLAMAEALHHKTDFLSVLPILERHAIWERVLQPICAVILMVWFRPSRVNDPRTPTAYANGAFMLMSRTCYNAIGGHEAVRDRINEDIPMAARAKQRGMRLRVVENEGLYVARMYDTPLTAFRGWSRIFYGSLEKPGRIALALSLVFVAGVVPWLSLLTALTAWIATGNAPWLTACLVWGGVVALLQIVTARLYSAVGYGLGWSLSYLIGAVVCAAILFSALLKSLRITRTTWRQTTYAATLPAREAGTAT